MMKKLLPVLVTMLTILIPGNAMKRTREHTSEGEPQSKRLCCNRKFNIAIQPMTQNIGKILIDKARAHNLAAVKTIITSDLFFNELSVHVLEKALDQTDSEPIKKLLSGAIERKMCAVFHKLNLN